MAGKTAKMVIDSYKDPDGWGQLIDELDLSEEKRRQFFEWCEYASLELVIDEDMNVVSGHLLPVK